MVTATSAPIRIRAGTVTTGVAAKLAGVAARTITTWFEKGLIKGHKVGADRRIKLTELVRFMESKGMEIPHYVRKLVEEIKASTSDDRITAAIELPETDNPLIRDYDRFQFAFNAYRIPLARVYVSGMSGKEYINALIGVLNESNTPLVIVFDNDDMSNVDYGPVYWANALSGNPINVSYMSVTDFKGLI